MRQLVGRAGELQVLRDLALDRARGRTVLVSGEAGIGKSSLVDAFADEVVAEGGRVAVGRTSAIGGPPFWSWQQILEELAPDAPLPWKDQTGEARAFVFPRVVELMRTALSPSVVNLLVVEDVHWEDDASLALLRGVIDSFPQVAGLLAITVREPAESASLARLLGDLPSHVTRLSLAGIDRAAAGAIVRGLLGPSVHDDIVTNMHERTGGNPYFLSEVARLHALQGVRARDTVPSGVQQVLDRRLARVSQRTNEVLTVAALCARIDTAVLADACGLATDAVDVALEEALRARLLVRSSDHLGFAHALVREVLSAGVGMRLTGLHRCIALALDQHGVGQDLDEQLALHWSQADGQDAPSRAAGHALTAARRAVRHMAYEPAVTLYDIALDGVAADGWSAVPADDLEVLVEAGEARVLAGDLSAGRDMLRRACRAALTSGVAPLAGRAVLGLGGGLGGFEVDLSDQAQADLLRAALEGQPDGDSGLRAALLARLSLATAWWAPVDERIVLAEQAVAMAERVGDARVLVSTLAAYCDAIAGPDHVHARRDAAGRMLTLASAVNDTRLVLLARRLRLVALLELGDIAEADREIAAYEGTVGTVESPLYRWPVPIWRGMRLLLGGDVAAALAHADVAAELGRRAGSRNALDMVFALRIAALLTTADPARALAVLDAEDLDPVIGQPGPECGLAGITAGAGRLDQARSYLDRRMAAGLDMVPKDSEWLEALWQLAVAAETLGDGPAMTRIVDALRPYAGVWVVDGIGGAVFGVVAHRLGCLSRALGDVAAARLWLDQALSAHRAAGATALVAGTQAALDDIGTATGHLSLTPEGGTFVREGAAWRVEWREQAALAPHTKGMADLARLVSAPGTAIDALSLMAPDGTVAAGDAGPTIDEQAKHAYRRRLRDLDEAIALAEAHGDLERLSLGQQEREFLLDELSGALGLGGRARRVGDPRERARKAVSMRVRTALRSLDAVHPELANHLTHSLSMGRFCSYDPEWPITWST